MRNGERNKTQHNTTIVIIMALVDVVSVWTCNGSHRVYAGGCYDRMQCNSEWEKEYGFEVENVREL